jgi:hypothetical protein
MKVTIRRLWRERRQAIFDEQVAERDRLWRGLVADFTDQQRTGGGWVCLEEVASWLATGGDILAREDPKRLAKAQETLISAVSERRFDEPPRFVSGDYEGVPGEDWPDATLLFQKWLVKDQY